MTSSDERTERLLSRLGTRDGVRIVRAPGRVNLIGEHTDYNLGYVMPAAIGLETWVASVPRQDDRVRIVSLQESGEEDFALDAPGEPQETWGDYVRGVVTVLKERGVPLRGVTAVLDSDIPVGSGLSSSAALELAAAWTVSERVPPPLDPLALAQAAQQAENEYVGVNSGLMDQFASANGRAGHALLFDCKTLEHQAIPLPTDTRLVAIDTRTPHRLEASEYNARRAQCERAVAALATRYAGVESLRDVTIGMLREAGDLLDEQTLRRSRHVVEENDRVIAAGNALADGQLELLGELFAASHASLRDLYEVSSAELDALVEIASNVPGVIGARMTGGGFGGCTVNLVRTDAVEPLRDAVAREYPQRAGREAGFYVVDAVDGAGVVS